MYEDGGIIPVIYGPYPDKTGRRRIVFVYPHRTTSISYARYLMQNNLGRELDKNEEVDHIDNDFTNDDIGNLQILSKEENHRKQLELQAAEIWTGNCGICGVQFSKAASQVRANLKQGRSGPYCSKSCAGKVGLKGCAKGTKKGTGRRFATKEI